MEQDSGLLHLVVEVSCGSPGDFHFGIQQVFEHARIAAQHIRVDIAAVRKHLQVDAARIRTPPKIGGADHGMHSDQHTVVLGANQLVVAGGHGFGQGAMLKQGHAVADHDGVEAVPRRSPHQHAITGRQFGVQGNQHKNGRISILHKQRPRIPAEVGDGGFEDDGNCLVGFDICQGVDGAQGGECGGRRGPGSGGASENDRESWNQPLH